MTATTATILFTDLVGSTEAAERAGPQAYERYRRQHFTAMRAAISAHRGSEVKTAGDSFMAVFDGAGDAVACGVAMQQAQARLNRRGIAAGLRVGISAGDVTKDGGDYFGMPVVEASRLCAAAGPGQVLVSEIVRLLDRSGGHGFAPAGALELKGIATPVTASVVHYDLPESEPVLARTPFVGRASQLAKLREKLRSAEAGNGGLVLVAGEPGIGKTRLLEEFTAALEGAGATVAWGACYEGDWAPPYGPFAQAISSLARKSETDSLRVDLGYGAAPLGRIVPAIRELLPDLGEPVPLARNEEQFRILDAAAQFLIATSHRRPLVLVLDDLHWADAASIAMLRHVSRFCPAERLLLVGTYRDVELDRQHPLADALAALRREVEYERLLLAGLTRDEVGELLVLVAEQESPPEFVEAISRETDGNPFFVREVLLHLVEEGKLIRRDGRWTAELSVSEMGIPEGVRQVIGRRLSRLSPAANQLLAAASAFSGPLRFDATASAAGLEESAALDAVDEALEAQLIRPAVGVDTYEFTHALIRHTLYGEMNPSRQVRLHRRLAEALEQLLGSKATEAAAEIAYQYHRSAAIPGAERGVAWALAAADRAEAGYAWDQVVTQLRLAVELIDDHDDRYPRLGARLGLALPLVSAPGESLPTILRAAEALAAAEGKAAAADYLADACDVFVAAGSWDDLIETGAAGVRYLGESRDRAWATLMTWSLAWQDHAGPDSPGIALEHPEVRDLVRQLRAGDLRGGELWPSALMVEPVDRDEALRSPQPLTRMFLGGDLRAPLREVEEMASAAEREGRLDWAASLWSYRTRALLALGEFDAAETSRRRGIELSRRQPGLANAYAQLAGSNRHQRAFATGDGWQAVLGQHSIAVETSSIPALFRAITRSFQALAAAACGEPDFAIEAVAAVQPAVERGSGSNIDYIEMTLSLATALWWSDRTDHAEAIERNLRWKILAPDFRHPKLDSRLCLAYLCALQGRHDEARHWFAEARRVLEESGARPLRAICDFDEAWALVRATGLPLTDPAFPPPVRADVEALLDAAMTQFQATGMPGWIRWAERLRAGVEVIERQPDQNGPKGHGRP